MKLSRSIILGCVLAGGIASAGVPVRPGPQAYKHLLGLMTTPRNVIGTPRPDPLADWQLAGISELENGYMVILANRKNAGEQMVIRPSGTSILGGPEKAAADFKVDSVEFNQADWRQTVVHLNCAGSPASIRFDEKVPVPVLAGPPKVAVPEARPRLPHPPVSASPNQSHAPAR